ncbi:hypothetical protein FH972_022377 [Carpinus fangiana]|uniref:amidase n=1 Tax=Carpinus fangiana TaxID=176857 RepID=A0A5N6KSG2_9ROSI|nr:hypothetical protein FH972_022377 [Carpinus fangiana]
MADTDAAAVKAAAEALVPKFQFERLLNQDQAGRRISLLGKINEEPAILSVERAAFSVETPVLASLAQTVTNVSNLGANDIYNWFMASTGIAKSTPSNLKLNLIYPCTAKHIKKYSSQGARTVTETPEIYRDQVRPYMQKQREAGHLDWVFNIIEGRTEQEDVIYREHSGKEDEGFLLLPDLNWDRKTITSLHLLGIVERRDIWSVRDLTKGHVQWLKHMKDKLLEATTMLYPQIEEDQIKLYVHYQPTYYHFHIHVVHVMLEAGGTQAVGKALSLDNIISQLETMDADDAGMKDVSLTYGLGEASDLWIDIFEPLKSERLKRKRDYRSIAATAQARRAAAIPTDFLLPASSIASLPKDVTTVATDSRHFTPEEVVILHADAETILANIASRKWTSLAVTEAFCKSAVVANQLTNCLTEILFQEAFARAVSLDEHMASTGKVIGPLHGLPMSIKDNFITPPHPSSIGMACFANVPTTPAEESVLIKMLHSLGAVIYVKTNVPTAMMMMETINNVWGETRNPHHTGCSSGGSSGGEAALIAMHGSPLGIGTDIGGSIRLPAAFCGLYGLKPSYGRYPQWAGRSGIPGQEFILAINGPISNSLCTLQLYSSAVLSSAAAPWRFDPKALPIPWRAGPHVTPTNRPLRLAILPPAADGLVTAHPPIERALRLTRAALEAAGHTVVDWDTTDHPEIVKMLQAAFFDFGSDPIINPMQAHGEPIFGSMAGYATAAAVGEISAGFTPSKMREMNAARNLLQKRALDQWQRLAADNGSGLDGIVAPVSPWAAPRLGVTNSDKQGRMLQVGFTAIFNLLDYPSCTFPVTRVDAAVDKVRTTGEWTPLNDVDRDLQADYDPAFYHGAPVSLQLVGERLSEEKVLEVTGIVKACLDGAGVNRWRSYTYPAMLNDISTAHFFHVAYDEDHSSQKIFAELDRHPRPHRATTLPTMEPHSSFYAIPAAYALGLVPHAYYLTRMMAASSFQWTNVTPRQNWELLKSKVPAEVYNRCLRARGAHLNALEGFPIFAAAVIATNVAKLPEDDIKSMAYQYLCARALYTVAYVGIKNEALSYVRTGLWGWSLAVPVLALLRSANAGRA